MSVAGVASIALLAATAAHKPSPRLVWNLSASAPKGLYAVRAGVSPSVGDMVVAELPSGVRWLAANRHYLPRNVPLVKRVAAGKGDHICAIGEALYINGTVAARRLVTDAAGREMPWWTGCQNLAQGEYLLLMRGEPGSFDGRYFGPLPSSRIIGKATLLWPS